MQNEHSHNSRLSRIVTDWDLFRRAHGEKSDEARDAFEQLFLRYERPIRNYLLASLHSDDATDEVLGEFASRLVSGRFGRVTPDLGRFRSYLKISLANMIKDFFKHKRRIERIYSTSADLGQLTESQISDGHGDLGDQAFDHEWKICLLNRAWQALKNHEKTTGKPCYTILRYRADHPDEPGIALAEAISRLLGHKCTNDAFRKALSRSRIAFGNFLIDEVAASISSNNLDAIEEEIADLRLLTYCKSALDRRRQREP